MIRFVCSLCGCISPEVDIEDNPNESISSYLDSQMGWIEYHRDSNGPKFACNECRRNSLSHI